MTTIAVHRTRNGALSSAESATVSITDSTDAVVVATTPVVPASIGVYTYTADALAPGSYTAIWTFTNAGYPDDVIVRVFTLDPPQAITSGVRLMDIEQLTARRVGPYRRVKATGGSTVARLASSRLVSSLDLGAYEDQFMLRRGITWTNTLVPNFNPDDRARMVAAYDSTNGWLVADTEWASPPDSVTGEAIEIMYLDPENELRPCVQDALKRCFYWDTVQISPSSAVAAYNVNITEIVPWLTDPKWIRDVSFSYLNQRLPAEQLQWWQSYMSGGSVYLQSDNGMLGTLKLDVLRPVSSYVNEETSLTGPNDDLDVLYVDPDYAAWAAVLELWKNHPERIQPLTVQNLRATREDAANEFSKKSLVIANQIPQRTVLRYTRSDLGSMQIGNLSEPV